MQVLTSRDISLSLHRSQRLSHLSGIRGRRISLKLLVGLRIGNQIVDFSSILASTGMDVEDILALLRLCLDTTYFQVNGSFL